MLLQGEPQCSSSGRRRARSWAASKPVVGICCEARPGELPNPALSCGLAVLDLLQVLSVSDRAAPSRGLQAPGREAVCLRGVWAQGLESQRPADAHQGQTQVRRNPCPLSSHWLSWLCFLPQGPGWVVLGRRVGWRAANTLFPRGAGLKLLLQNPMKGQLAFCSSRFQRKCRLSVLPLSVRP